jgi:hypothetical protein
MAHDFREMLSSRFTGGSVTVLAFALLFLPVFLWLGPMWLLFYWLAIFFPYAGAGERTAVTVLLILLALLPVAAEYNASRIAGVEVRGDVGAFSHEQAYQPEALCAGGAPGSGLDHPCCSFSCGNMQSFEGNEEQAQQHYNRAIELRRTYRRRT